MTHSHDNFTGLAGVYDGARPGYPVAAIRAIVDGLPAPVRVLDVGCGTGIASRLLATTGARVTGIDPNPDMLAAARARDPVGPDDGPVVFRQGSAERTGVDDESCDLVTCFQSFHWVDAEAALAEFARVLRPGGRLALVWNVRDPGRDAMTAGYQETVERAQADARSRGIPVRPDRSFSARLIPGFSGRRRLDFDNPQVVDRAALLRRAASASYYPREGTLRAELDDRLAALFESHAIGGRVAIAQRTEVTLAERT